MTRLGRIFGGPVRCRAVAARLDAYVDGELGERERQRIAAHLAACASCRAAYDELARQVGVIESLPRVAPSADLRRRIMAALPERPAPRRAARPAPAWRWAFAGVMVVWVVMVALVYFARGPKPQEPLKPSPPERITQGETPAPSPTPVMPSPGEPGAPETPAAGGPRRPVTPQPTPPREPAMLADARELRDLASSYEREGQWAEALEAHQQADAAAQARGASLDTARVYEKMGYIAHAVDRYADLALAPVGEDARDDTGGG